jgi:F0F1-type ATP synthase membrane subunit c/vacuolar-type H+-ATPase subunit K
VEQPPDATAFNRVVKVLYFALFASVGLYWFITGFISPDAELTPPPVIAQVLTLLAASVTVAVAFLRFNRIPHVQSHLLTDPNALNQLRVLYIVCFALAESVAVYGLVLYLLGAPRDDASWFFLGSAALFAACYPKSLESPPGLS